MGHAFRAASAAGALGVLVMAGSAVAQAAPAKGSGATFPSAAYAKWGADSGLATYEGVGSGAGIDALIAGTVDFAGSDALLSGAELGERAAARGAAAPVYFPTLLGAITVPANVRGVKKPLKLDPAALGKIFTGAIKKWNDPGIARTNPGVKLPKAKITVCVRSDSSGTTFNFTSYLGKASAPFRNRIKPSKTPAWTTKTKGAEGNTGVADCIKTTKNAIGYVDLGDALKNGLKSKIAAIKGAGATAAYVTPSRASISAAAAGGKVPANLVLDLFASKGAGAYPIVTTTYVVAYSSYGAAGNANVDGVKAFLAYAYGAAAQGALGALNYAPLPAAVASAAAAKAATLS
jgi:phosphate transport system substrate-binding protein